ncbi:gamma-interferon-responsive lysosomal thiol protein-like isoform X2 [Bidens hawaiensis]|uniref:gamma-interferon-responsive lysosomal thiol protein-like isoform X2 n=1 Tax=Bidens hawaiensis TaxID=980011 RepID=UPI004049C326
MLNAMEACAMHVWPVPTDHFPFIYCVEKLYQEKKYTEWETCFEELDLDPKPVLDCYNSGIGQALGLQYIDEVNALEPPKQYVPWIVVDGNPLYADYTNFVRDVCKAYRGSNIPRACLGITRPVTIGPNRVGLHVNEL